LPLFLKIFTAGLKYFGESYEKELFENLVSYNIFMDNEEKIEESNI
jgi:hypothetical protein